MKRILSLLLVVLVTGCGAAAEQGSAMPKTEIYQVVDYNNESPDLTRQINFILNQISNRLDKFEAIRGTQPTFFETLRRMDDVSTKNADLITVSSSTLIVYLKIGTVQEGDLVFAQGVAFMGKGATAGFTNVIIKASTGTTSVPASSAAIVAFHDFPSFGRTRNVAINENSRDDIGGMFVVTRTGTLYLEMTATSSGSDSTITSGNAQMRAIVMRGQPT